VLVRSDLLAEDHQVGVAVPLGHIPEHLVVGPILLDDVNDVLKHARLAMPLGHRAARLLRARRLERRQDRRHPAIAHRGFCQLGQLFVGRQLDERQ
jgi:hypothetical protein